MKKIVLAGLALSLISATALAQKQPAKANATTKKTATAKRSKTAPASNEPVVLVNTTNHAAAAPDTTLRITDPTIQTFNLRASGAEVPAAQSGIMGLPKGTYGFANGRLFLRKTSASSSGTGYGSGAVGTGTSIQSSATGEATLGVNGKSPDAGAGMWGDKQPVKPIQPKPSTDKKEE